MSAVGLAGVLNLRRSGREWRGACPACGYASNAFALFEKSGRVRGWCASCGDRAAISGVLERLQGGEAFQRPDPPPGPITPNLAQRTAAALAVWSGAAPAGGTPAALYLARRALPDLAASTALRWRPDVAHPSGGGGRHAAMVALVTDVDGNPQAVHRTYLTRDGRKADLTPVKASKGPVAGGAIRLHPVAAEMVVAEGIETAAAAGVLMGLPAWAAVAAGNLERTMMLPPEVRSVIIAGDPDPPGRAAAEGAARRWRAEGRRVRIAMPDTPPQDFNDLLMSQVSHG
jgi:putative DNA primase/helicase